MTLFFGLLLTAVAFALVTYPFYRQRARQVSAAENEKLRELQSRRDTSYSMLKELEFDHASGILTEEDYHDLQERYKKKAIKVLKEMDGLGQAIGEEDDIERRVLELRKMSGEDSGLANEIEKHVRQLRKIHRGESGIENEIERQVRHLRQARKPAAIATERPGKSAGELPQERHFCSQCGAKVLPADRFCSSCGSALN